MAPSMKDSKVVMGNIRTKARRGVSLIEVLVVLVLLVLGILIIVRLFPSGFFSINSVGDAALADSLGQAAVQSQVQDATALPDSILPGTLTTLTSANGSYDPEYNASAEPDYSKTLDRATVINNETITIPAASGPTRQSVYVLNYGPILLGTTGTPINPAGPDLSQLANYLTVNSPAWTAISGDETAVTRTPPDFPQDTLFPRQERFLVDLANKQIAVPYADYTLNGTQTTVGTSAGASYSQKIVVSILANGVTYTQYLNVPAATPRNNTTPYAPKGTDNSQFLPDTPSNYQGGWFDPTTTYLDPSPPLSQTSKAPPSNVQWQRVTLYRPYQAVVNGGTFSSDPYEFQLASANFGNRTPVAGTAPKTDVNPGTLSFNPKAAGGSGSSALKAQISYQTVSWRLLHEDRDVPSLPSGNTAAIRLTLKNLKRAGDPNADNTIYKGLADSSQSLVIVDLDTGATVAPDPLDPTVLNDEDLNGTITDDKTINVSYATGRITFPYNAFGDNPAPGKTPRAHRIRIFFAGDADWTVAVQKAPSYYTANINSLTSGTDPLILPTQYAFDSASKLVYFPRCDAGKTVEVDGTYISGGQLQSFAETAAISPVVSTTVGGTYVTVNLADKQLAAPLPTGASSITISAVRGLSARAVVAWKERDRWKIHTVDTILTRAQ